MRLSKLLAEGIFVVTVETPTFGDSDSTQRLAAVLDDFAIPATWCTADPVGTAQSVEGNRSHEVALLITTDWSDEAIARPRFARELSRRIAEARSQEVAISSVAEQQFSIRHQDLLLKQGITAVRGPLDCPEAKLQHTAPQSLRYGLWKLPIAHKLPQKTGWLASASGPVKRDLQRISQSGGACHLAIDLAAAASHEQQELRTLRAILKRVVRHRERDGLKAITLCQLSTRLSQTPHSRPTQSILRKAG